jgi:hypothetical protein
MSCPRARFPGRRRKLGKGINNVLVSLLDEAIRLGLVSGDLDVANPVSIEVFFGQSLVSGPPSLTISRGQPKRDI